MDNIVLSLIVPVYGVEKYIGDFLQSLEPNLIPGVEVIIIDDGTKDKSGLIADEFAAEHNPFVSVIHKENGGVSSARNAGMEVARGEYLIFPDSDDILECNYVEQFLDAIKDYNYPDLIFCNYKELKDGLITCNSSPCFEEGFVPWNKYFKMIANEQIWPMVWSISVKKSIIENTRFKLGCKNGEDTLFVSEFAARARKIVFLDKPLYIYRRREGSATAGVNFKIYMEAFKIIRYINEQYNKSVQGLSIVGPTNRCCSTLKEAYSCDITGFEVEYCEKFIKDNFFTILLDGEVSINTKKQCFLVILGVARIYIKSKYEKG